MYVPLSVEICLRKSTSKNEQRAKKVVSDSRQLVNFAVLNLPNGKVTFFGIQITENCNRSCSSNAFLGMFEVVRASNSLPKWQAVN